MCQETMALLDKIIWILIQILRIKRVKPRKYKVKIVERVTYEQRYSITYDN